MGKRREAYNPLLKSYPDSEKINAVSEGAEVLYVRLIAACDDADRYYGDPAYVLAKLFTVRMAASQLTKRDIENRLSELESVRLVTFYNVRGVRYVQLLDRFKTLRKDVKAQIVFPDPVTETVTDTLRGRNADGPLDPDRDPEPLESGVPDSSASPAAALSEFTFPTTGKGRKDWTLTSDKLVEYIEAYPGLDVLSQMRKARQWCRDKPRQRKTAGGMLSFLTSWLNREQNNGRTAVSNPEPADRVATGDDLANWNPGTGANQ